MKCLRLHQPWASLLAISAKKIETRSWSTEYRGLVAIHAAKKWTGELRNIALTEPFVSSLGSELRLYRPWGNYLPLGAIVGVGYLRDCIGISLGFRAQRLPDLGSNERDFGDFTYGRFAWVFDGVRKLDQPIPFKGQQRLWELDIKTANRLRVEMLNNYD